MLFFLQYVVSFALTNKHKFSSYGPVILYITLWYIILYSDSFYRDLLNKTAKTPRFKIDTSSVIVNPSLYPQTIAKPQFPYDGSCLPHAAHTL